MKQQNRAHAACKPEGVHNVIMQGFVPSAARMAQHSTAQHSTAQHSTAQHSTAQRSTAQHSAAQRSTAQHSAAQRSTAQHSAAQRSTAQHSAAQRSAAQHSTASTAQHSAAQHSAAQHSTAQHSTAQRSTAQHSTAQHSALTSPVAHGAVCIGEEVICLERPRVVVLMLDSHILSGSGIESIDAAILIDVVNQLVHILIVLMG